MFAMYRLLNIQVLHQLENKSALLHAFYHKSTFFEQDYAMQ